MAGRVDLAERDGQVAGDGIDAAGRRQYLYDPEFRARQEQAKYDKLIRFAERLPDLRAAMSEHMDRDSIDRERVGAVATRLINRAWFRVGTERYAERSKTFGITTLMVRTTLVDAEIAAAIDELLQLKGGRRVFRYEWEGGLYNLTGRRLND